LKHYARARRSAKFYGRKLNPLGWLHLAQECLPLLLHERAHAAGPGDVCVPTRPCIPNNGLITPQGELPPRWLLQGHPAAQLFTRSLTHFLRSATISMSASYKHRNLPAVSQLKPHFNSFCNASNKINSIFAILCFFKEPLLSEQI
jgi:hypothetical protein